MAKKGKTTNDTEAVNEFMAKLDHPFKTEVQAVREILMNVNPGIKERIKWNAPSFSYKEDYLMTFNLHARNHVHLVFHNPAIVQVNSGLLEGDYKDRRMVYFPDLKAVETNQQALEAVVKDLIALIDKDPPPRASTRNTIFIKAPPAVLYQAFTDPAALAVWFAPGDMTGKVHNFDLKAGGGYQMSLYYPSTEQSQRGKTSEKEDRYTARFVELTPPRRIVEAIIFDSADPAFSGEMIMEVTLEAGDGGTTVTILFKDIPPGIRPEDNEAGTRLTLEKLARFIEGDAGRSA